MDFQKVVLVLNLWGNIQKKTSGSTKKIETMKILEIILAIILPPLGVGLKFGISGKFWLNLLLTILGYIPGIIHALVVIVPEKPAG